MAVSSLEGRRVLITGAQGFLGSRLAAALSRSKMDVAGIVRRDTKDRGPETLFVVNEDFSNLNDIVSEFAPDVVIHTATRSLAGRTEAELTDMVRINVLFPSLLLHAMERYEVRSLINCSSSWQTLHGIGYEPFNFYAATKQACEDVIDDYVHRGLRCISLRLFDTYGEGDWRGKVVQLIIDSILTQRTLGMSPGHQKMSLVHIDDVCAALETALMHLAQTAKPGHEIFSVVGYPLVSLRDLVRLVEKHSGMTSLIEFGARPYRPLEIMEPRTPYPTIPGWAPRIDLSDGIARYIAATRRHPAPGPSP